MESRIVVKGQAVSSKNEIRKSFENRKNFDTLKSLMKKIKKKLCKSS